MTFAIPPPGMPERLWLVSRPNGDRFFVDREPLEGMREWAEGQVVTVLRYDFAGVVYDKRLKVKK